MTLESRCTSRLGRFVAAVYFFQQMLCSGHWKSTVPLDGLHIRNNVGLLNVTRTNVDLGITVTDDLKPNKI